MTTSVLPRISNRNARRLFLHRHALGEAPIGSAKGDALLALIKRIGFVQIDSINSVARAHHMILFARLQSYRQGNLEPLLHDERTLFEHWTHDASIIPSEFFPHWRLRFARSEEKMRPRWEKWQKNGFGEKFDAVFEQVRDGGSVCSSDVGKDEVKSSGGWWEWHPSKTALEYLWRTGVLSICHRKGFRKFFNLTERVIPAAILQEQPSPEETIDWACNAAIDRLGFATSREIAAFWETLSAAEAKTWCTRELQSGALIEVEIEGADKTLKPYYTRPDVIDVANNVPAPPGRMRVLSPFDPVLRDRKRALRLFGFEYTIEIYVPAAQRKYGYYVFPLLEGDRLAGRIDMQCDRKADVLRVTAVWPEKSVKFTGGRVARLEAELNRMARFSLVKDVVFADGWLRDTV